MTTDEAICGLRTAAVGLCEQYGMPDVAERIEGYADALEREVARLAKDSATLAELQSHDAGALAVKLGAAHRELATARERVRELEDELEEERNDRENAELKRAYRF